MFTNNLELKFDHYMYLDTIYTLSFYHSCKFVLQQTSSVGASDLTEVKAKVITVRPSTPGLPLAEYSYPETDFRCKQTILLNNFEFNVVLI